jgi:hypothetical protein
MNTALLDQTLAANRELETNVRAFADARGYDLWKRRDEWMDGVVTKLRSNISSGKVKVCPHVRAPMPVVSAAWALDVVVCGLCAVVFDLSADPIADTTCDRCGVMTAGSIWPSAFVVGAVLVTYGACGRCHRNLQGDRHE